MRHGGVGMINRIACGGFLTSWITAGGAIERVLDDWRATAIFAVSVVVMIASAAVIASYQKWDD